MYINNVEATNPEGNHWAEVLAETVPRPGASFSRLLSWVLDLATHFLEIAS